MSPEGIFCHRTALIGVEVLQEGESVAFELAEGTKKGSGKLAAEHVVAASSRKRADGKLSGTAHRWDEEKVMYICQMKNNNIMCYGMIS